MCGIVGFLGKNACHRYDETLLAMMAELTHRGPDAGGIWVDLSNGVALGHRRLSIVDLSPTGNQPMKSSSARYIVVFNGEIYNHHKIRKEIELISGETPISWYGHSDTEVLLAAVEVWGLEEALKRFVGMFAFALWDCRERMLHLVRDRLGEKPLYYGWIGSTLVFASELKAIRAYPAWQSEIDRNALALFFRHNYIPAPYSIYKHIKKLLPGYILTVSNHELHSMKPYWSAKEIVEAGKRNPFIGSDTEAIDHLHVLLGDSIAQQMVADVPLGAFLSGGIDSSTVVALMQSVSSKPVRTFTIGFEENEYNEATAAGAVARYLGTDHTELYVTPNDALAVIPKLPAIYDEPFADFSQIPTFLICQLTKRYVTVSLSGDGGDELFGGYTRYILAERIWRAINKIPDIGRKMIILGIKTLPEEFVNQFWGWLKPIFERYGSSGNADDKLRKFSEILSAQTEEELYLALVSHWKKPANIVFDAEEPPTVFTKCNQWANLKEYIDKMMFFDLISYLPDDILVKLDRAAMAVSLEARVPFLDYRIVEYAWKISLSLKIRNGESKWILRQVLYKHVPRKLIERPKKGFSVPIGEWLRGPLREWAESMLSERRIREEGFLHFQPIRDKWDEHLSGRRNWQFYLWDVLMFQSWLAEEKIKSCKIV